MATKRLFGFTRRLETLEQRHMLSVVGFVTHEVAQPVSRETVWGSPIDIDGDSDLDLFTSKDGRLGWSENRDGRGEFRSGNHIGRLRAGNIEAADIDDDGWIDVLAGPVWYKNVGGGNFDSARPIPIPGTHDISYAVDLDGDRDLDIVTTGPFGEAVTWLENVDGLGSFEHRETMQTQLQRIYFEDLNGDNLTDIFGFTANSSPVPIWFENSESEGPFGRQQPLAVGDIGELTAVDWDGDQDIDLISRAFRPGGMRWYENDGKGSFSPFASWATQSDVRQVKVGDVDADDDLDVVIVTIEGASGPIELRRESVSWIENSEGTPVTDSVRPVLSDQYLYVISISDIDGDNSLDLVASGRGGTFWLEYLNQGGEFGEPHWIVQRPAIVDRAHAEDVDTDQLDDIVWTNQFNDQQGWFRQDPNGAFEESRPLPDTYELELPYAGDRAFVDIDGDDDDDIVDRSGGEYWFERDGETYHRRKIGGFDSSPLNYEVADLDGDGDTDLIALSWRAEKWTLSWGENVGGEFATEHVLSGQFGDRTLKVYPIDVDQDGDYDIVVEPKPGLLRWYDNDGAGGFSGPRLPAARLEWIARLMYADGNGDGLTDQIIADAGNAISWDQPLQSKFALNFEGDDWLGVDLDADGDVDVINIDRGWLRWRENHNGSWRENHNVRLGSSVLSSANGSFSDVDSDGDLDILSSDRGRVFWHENRLSGDVNDDGEVGFDDFLAMSANFGTVDAIWEDGDFTGDGVVSFEDFLSLSANFGLSRPRQG